MALKETQTVLIGMLKKNLYISNLTIEGKKSNTFKNCSINPTVI